MRTSPLRPFSKPRTKADGTMDAEQVRGALNQLQNALAPITTTVSTSAVSIYEAPSGQAVAHVTGDDGTDAFADTVAWHPKGSVAVSSSLTTKGSPAIRSYAVNGGVLMLHMSTGTYTVQVIPTLFE